MDIEDEQLLQTLISPEKKKKMVVINAVQEEKEEAVSESTEDVVSIEPDKHGDLPLPLKGITAPASLLMDIDPVGQLYQQKQKQQELK